MLPAMNALRLFIALPLSAALKKNAESLQNRGMRQVEGIRWVAPTQMHLTLLFLGRVPPEKQAQIETMICETAACSQSFTLEFSGVGVFPHIQSPKVVWAGVSGVPALMALQETLALQIAKIPFPVETRPFRPHLTLGRIRGKGSVNALRAWIKQEEGVALGACRMSSVCLMESQLSTQGARYITCLEAPLKSVN